MGKKIISLADPALGDEEKQSLTEVIDSGWLTMGERVRRFECEFAKMHEMEEAVAVSSCTAGLHLCLAALGIGPGDEVLVPSLTFVATVNAVLYTGARPVFVDIESIHCPHISIEDARKKVTEKTKAVILMHYGGYLVDMTRWSNFSKEFGLFIIEDAAHAPGGKGIGQKSHGAAFSFFTNKNMTTAEGGMVISKNREFLSKVRSMRSHGMTTLTLERYKGHAYSYDVTMLGYNYRMDELRAALGLSQIGRLEKWNEKRRHLSDHYRFLINKLCSQVQVPFNSDWPTCAHLMAVILPDNTDRNHIMQKLRDEGIQSSIHYPPIHGFSHYRRLFPDIRLPITEEFCNRELTLPLHPGLDKTSIEYIIRTLSSCLG